jgi:hypothetical protein
MSRLTTPFISPYEIMAATGIQSLDEVREAFDELERFGLIRVTHRPSQNSLVTILDPTGWEPPK